VQLPVVSAKTVFPKYDALNDSRADQTEDGEAESPQETNEWTYSGHSNGQNNYENRKNVVNIGGTESTDKVICGSDSTIHIL